jgi:alkylated DNA repair dioxygenase AlkB
MKNLLSGSDECYYLEDFLNQNEAFYLFEVLKKQVVWEHFHVSIFGKKVLQPRLTALYGDQLIHYKYSGKDLKAKTWLDSLNALKSLLENTFQISFNSVLCNYYRDGLDSMGWHRDNEKSLGTNPIIASLTFGAERTFILRHYFDKKLKKEILLKNGSLLLMMGTTQTNWEHSIPKVRHQIGERINLTFRNIKM